MVVEANVNLEIGNVVTSVLDIFVETCTSQITLFGHEKYLTGSDEPRYKFRRYMEDDRRWKARLQRVVLQ